MENITPIITEEDKVVAIRACRIFLLVSMIWQVGWAAIIFVTAAVLLDFINIVFNCKIPLTIAFASAIILPIIPVIKVEETLGY